MTSENEHPGKGPEHEAGFDDEAPFDDFESGGGNFKELMQNNPMVKVGMIVGIVVLIVGAMILFGGKKSNAPLSVIKGANNDVNEAPGTGQVSDTYRKAVQESNAQDVEKALKTGTSALPVPVAAPVGRVPITETPAATEDPLERWRRLQEDRQQRETQQKPLPKENPNAAAIKDLANAMSTQMESILTGLKPEHSQHETVTQTNFLDPKPALDANGQPIAGSTAVGGQQAINQGQGAAPVEIIVPAGSIAYAQLITEANSDVKGPILAQIVGGPLAGDRALGTFDLENQEYLILKFDTVIIDGIGHPTNAVAVDPSTNSEALQSDIDHHYFERIILPAAASFLQGLGSAVANTGSTVSQSASSTTTSSPPLDVKQQVFAGISTAAQQAGTVLTSDGQRTQPTVIVAAGTTMGLMFVQPVTDQTKN